MHRTRVHVIAGVFWFIAVAFGWELAWSLTGIPRIVGPVLGVVIGLVVALDPMAVIWPAAPVAASTSLEPGASGVKPLAGGRVVAPDAAALEHAPAGEAPQTAGGDL